MFVASRSDAAMIEEAATQFADYKIDQIFYEALGRTGEAVPSDYRLLLHRAMSVAVTIWGAYDALLVVVDRFDGP